jgi:hypothetical protein
LGEQWAVGDFFVLQIIALKGGSKQEGGEAWINLGDTRSGFAGGLDMVLLPVAM